MSRVILGEQDRQILKFIWRFKISTTSVLAARFFPKQTQWSVYQRLWRLASGGFIRSFYPDSGRHHFWGLDEKGFEIVKSDLPNLLHHGFKSENLRHDYLVLAAHVGSWLTGEPKNVAFVTEQELRRIDPSAYSNSVPKSQIHRPDGYWCIENGTEMKLVALEVELSQKAYEIYESVARFYYKDALVDQVLWLVDRKEQAQRMLERFEKVVQENAGVHSFALLKDFVQHNWQAKIVIGKDQNHTILDVLQNYTKTRQENVFKFNFFDTRKNPKDSSVKQKRESIFNFN